MNGGRAVNYRYDSIHVLPIDEANSGDFPQYPCPWFVLITSSGRLVGDGPTPEAAKADHPNDRLLGMPSPAAEAKARSERMKRRQRREARQGRQSGTY